MFGSVGFPELLLVFVIVLLLFGPKKLPEFAKFLGKAIREFRSTVDEAKSAIEEEIEKADVTQDLKKIDREVKDAVYGDIQSDIQKLGQELQYPAPPAEKKNEPDEKKKTE